MSHGGVAIGRGHPVLVYWVLAFLRMGTVGLTAQARNNDDAEVAALVTGGG